MTCISLPFTVAPCRSPVKVLAQAPKPYISSLQQVVSPASFTQQSKKTTSGPEHGHLSPPFLTTSTSQTLLNRICTSYPYCKLDNIRSTSPDAITAAFSPEAATYYDLGHKGVSTGELVRHMAIAGSVACALTNPSPGRHYYLAVGGTFYGSTFFKTPETTASATARGESGAAGGGGVAQLPDHTVLSRVLRAEPLVRKPGNLTLLMSCRSWDSGVCLHDL